MFSLAIKELITKRFWSNFKLSKNNKYKSKIKLTKNEIEIYRTRQLIEESSYDKNT